MSLGSKLSPCVKIGLFALLFGSSVTYLRICGPLVSQLGGCNNTTVILEPSTQTDTHENQRVRLTSGKLLQTPVDLELERIIYKTPGMKK